MALTQDQLDKMRDDLVAAIGNPVNSTRYGDKAVQYRSLDDLMRAWILMQGLQPDGMVGNPGTGRYKLATVQTKGYRAPGPGGYSYRNSGDFYSAKPWNRR